MIKTVNSKSGSLVNYTQKNQIHILGLRISLYKKTKTPAKLTYSFLGIPFLKVKYKTKHEGLTVTNTKKHYLLGIPLFLRKKTTINNQVLLDRVQRSISTAFLHQQIFSSYKNLYVNQDIVIVGAGPSVSNYTQPIPQAIHIGCNRAFLFDKVKFNYLFTCDKAGIEDYYEPFLSYVGQDCIKFIGDLNCGPEFQIPESYILKSGAKKYHTTGGMMKSKFTLNLESEPLGAFHTISLQAMQFALYTNPRRIYLVGIDCAHQGKHFEGKSAAIESRNENIDQLQLTQIEEWKELKKFASLYYPDTEIISIHPVGLAGLFKDITL